MKLIKISDTHYIIVDDSPSENDHIFYNSTIGKLVFAQDDTGQGYEIQIGSGISYPIYDPLNVVKKITHSTRPLNSEGFFDYPILPIELSEVEKAIYGYSVEDMALEYDGRMKLDVEFIRAAFKAGFRKHKELTKDKLFTSGFILDLVNKVLEKQQEMSNSDFNDWYNSDFLKMLFPRKEWDITIDEQCKITLI